MTTEYLRQGCLAAAERFSATPADDLLSVSTSVTEVLFSWRCLDESQSDKGSRSPANLPPRLAMMRPGLVWARNTVTHESMVMRPVPFASFPLRLPTLLGPHVVWRAVESMTAPEGRNQDWNDRQVTAYRNHLSECIPHTAVEEMIAWVRSLSQ